MPLFPMIFLLSYSFFKLKKYSYAFSYVLKFKNVLKRKLKSQIILLLLFMPWYASSHSFSMPRWRDRRRDLFYYLGLSYV